MIVTGLVLFIFFHAIVDLKIDENRCKQTLARLP